MRSSLKLLGLLACALLATGTLAPAKDEKPKGGNKEAAKKKGKDKEKDKKAEAKKGDDGTGKLSLPLVEKHDSIGLKIPYYDTTGKLQMTFAIGVATRLDEDNVQMKETQVQTFDSEGEAEMTIELPTSTLNLSTRVITSKTKTTIKRDDFMITGDSVQFNTLTKQGKLVGNVHMTIYNLDDEAADSTEGKSE